MSENTGTCKFTSGPWIVRDASAFRTSTMPCAKWNIEDAAGKEHFWIAITIDEANARLIAAAPEMYEALKAAYEHLEYCGYGDSWERECAAGLDKQIESALAKAEGRENV